MDGEHPEIPAGRQAPCGGGQGGSADFGGPFSLYRSARPFNFHSSPNISFSKKCAFIHSFMWALNNKNNIPIWHLSTSPSHENENGIVPLKHMVVRWRGTYR